MRVCMYIYIYLYILVIHVYIYIYIIHKLTTGDWRQVQHTHQHVFASPGACIHLGTVDAHSVTLIYVRNY